MMRVLVIGSSAREHTIIWKLLQSRKDLEVIAAPGNGGISEFVECVDIQAHEIDRLYELAVVRQVNLTIVGSTLPAALGIVNKFRKEGLKVFGPTSEASQIDWSKYFAKEFMLRHNIPSPKYAYFEDEALAIAYASNIKPPLVIKQDGFDIDKDFVEQEILNKTGIGKRIGSTLSKAKYTEEVPRAKVTYDVDEAKKFIKDCFRNKSSMIAKRVVIEEYIEGHEVSVFAICDGNAALTMLPAQFYTKKLDGDEGPIAKGMGAYAPATAISNETMQKVRHEIINPTMDGLRSEGRPYTGVMTIELIVDEKGDPKVLEYNACFGDPESQVVLPLLDEDLFDICMASAKEDISGYQEGFHKYLGSALSITLASSGYPEIYEGGKPIDFSGLNERDASLSGSPGELEQVLKAKSLVFHCATRKNGRDFVTDGGRVISATAVAENLVDAQVLAYKLANKINFDGKFFRKDIGDQGMV